MKKSSTSKQSDDLYKAILSLKSPSECKAFFRDLCTISEIKAMEERLQVAKALMKKIAYREISKKTGASTATITRVAYWLNHGSGGYERVISRLSK